MLKVLDSAREDNAQTTEGVAPTLDEVAREGARRMLPTALEEEVAHYIEAHADARDADGRRLALPCTHIIRSGQLQHAPAVQCGSRWLRWTFVRNRAT